MAQVQENYSMEENGDTRQQKSGGGGFSYYYHDQSPGLKNSKRTSSPQEYSPRTSPMGNRFNNSYEEDSQRKRSSSGRHQQTYDVTSPVSTGSKTSKRGSLPDSRFGYRDKSGKRNSFPGEERRNRQQQKDSKEINKRLSNSIASSTSIADRKRLDDSFERRLSNSIAIPGLFEDPPHKRTKSGKTGKNENISRTGGQDGDNKDKIDLNISENSAPPGSPPRKENRSTSNSSSSAPSNIDETGENAKLLSVRRIGTPERVRKHEEEGADNSTSSSINDGAGAPDVFLPKRYILAIMMFMGFVNMYAVRVNLNVAIGAMVNNHTIVKDGVASVVPPEFNWSSRLQGVVLGSFYYGYMILQIPGGYFALKFGGTKIFGIGVFLASVLTLLTPFATRYNVWALVVLRILEGLVLGVMLPCNHQIWASWAPLPERTTLVTLAISGMNVGTVVTMPLTGLLTKYGFDGGWASVFYCFGVFGIVWYILWILVVHATPGTHPTISKKERQYIENNTVTRKSTNIPWCTILTSRPVWAVIIGNICNDWGLYTILICLPIFLMDIMKFNIQTMGFIASLPFLLKAITGPVGGVIADVLRYKYMSTANVRRLFYAVGAIGAAILIVITGYSHSPTIAVVSMCLGVAMSGLLHSGYEVNVLDIAPGLSGIVMGITNTAGTTTGFLSPLFVGYMTENKKRSEWIIVFWMTFVFYVVGTILYCLLLSGETQHWAIDDEDEEARDNI